MATGQLVRNGIDENAKYACYELRIGDRIEELVMDNNGDEQQDIYRSKHIPEDGVFKIIPGQTFKIFAKETLNMPSNVTAFAFPVGNLYKLGVHPETTFADPGFQNEFYITVCNYSPRIVKLKVGEPLARLFFFHLNATPARRHSGNPRPMPPSVERVPRRTPEELAALQELDLIGTVLSSVDPPHYEHAFVTQRVAVEHRKQVEDELNALRKEQVLFRSLIAVLGLTIASIAGVMIWEWTAGRWPSLVEGVGVSVVSALILAGLGWLLARVIGWLSGKRTLK
jgi:deoxycytidine triphosphate deaminase